MLDQMSMPVLFIVVIVLLGLVTGGLFLGIRILGSRQHSGGPSPGSRPEDDS
ncbi:hypothetical protein BH24ACT12_BH24ACT12_06560 [soil metagenome]|jgi:uncharacterized protein YneF (UPF0154 family)